MKWPIAPSVSYHLWLQRLKLDVPPHQRTFGFCWFFKHFFWPHDPVLFFTKELWYAVRSSMWPIVFSVKEPCEWKSNPLPSPPVPPALQSYGSDPVNPREQLLLIAIWLPMKCMNPFGKTNDWGLFVLFVLLHRFSDDILCWYLMLNYSSNFHLHVQESQKRPYRKIIFWGCYHILSLWFHFHRIVEESRKRPHPDVPLQSGEVT